MPLNPWSEEELNDGLEALVARADRAGLSPAGVLEERLDYREGFGRRRLKAAVVLALIWGLVIGLNLVPWGAWPVRGLLLLLSLQAVRMIAAQPDEAPAPLAGDASHWPTVALMAAAKDEEAVIGRLVTDLCNLDYPRDRYEVWIIDDNSSDGTGEVLKQLQRDYSQLNVFRRSPQATGGKSGALNQVIPRTKADFIAIFDADARVPQNLLKATLPRFDDEKVGAVQVRKVTAKPLNSFLLRGQSVEMMLDGYFQQQRTAIGGLGELRGNGAFLRRSALVRCGGFNEETITDDLDLTLRLNLDGWDVAFSLQPGVGEEGVVNLKGLWHQRNRWAEGGYQRYLDYWRLAADNRMGTNRTLEVLGFLIIQYLLPMAMVPDLLMALLLGRVPLLAPMSVLSIGLPYIAMTLGIRRAHRAEQGGANPPLVETLGQSALGMMYLIHWFVIMAAVTIRMAFRKKRLKWVKTVHGVG
ncbi:MAG: glycosyltransferase family 2 protein [Synechococcales cyanobacterium RM1_1_8]|nr:glycosyltransferase family 2 protein [Synechococcales cyanobacterium RM1_1_8]